VLCVSSSGAGHRTRLHASQLQAFYAQVRLGLGTVYGRSMVGFRALREVRRHTQRISGMVAHRVLFPYKVADALCQSRDHVAKTRCRQHGTVEQPVPVMLRRKRLRLTAAGLVSGGYEKWWTVPRHPEQGRPTHNRSGATRGRIASLLRRVARRRLAS